MTDARWAVLAAKYFPESPDRYSRALALCAEVERQVLERLTLDDAGHLHHERSCAAILVERLLAHSTTQAAQIAALRQERDAWRQAALRIGEDLSTDGPTNYYNFTPVEWRTWALGQHSANAIRASLTLTEEDQAEVTRLNTIRYEAMTGQDVRRVLAILDRLTGHAP